MSLSTRLAAPPAPKTNQTILDRWLNELPDSDKTAVQRVLADTAWKHTDLITILIEEGMPEVSVTTLGAWRRRNGYTK